VFESRHWLQKIPTLSGVGIFCAMTDSSHFMRQSGGLWLVSGWTETTLQCFESRRWLTKPLRAGLFLEQTKVTRTILCDSPVDCRWFPAGRKPHYSVSSRVTSGGILTIPGIILLILTASGKHMLFREKQMSEKFDKLCSYCTKKKQYFDDFCASERWFLLYIVKYVC